MKGSKKSWDLLRMIAFPLFSETSEHNIKCLIEHSKRIQVDKGEEISLRNPRTQMPQIIILIEGALELQAEGCASMNKILEMGSGEIVGLWEAMNNLSHPYSLCSKTNECVVYQFDIKVIVVITDLQACSAFGPIV